MMLAWCGVAMFLCGWLALGKKPYQALLIASITGNEISSSFRAINPRAEPKTVPPMRSKARGTTFPQNEIGPMTTTAWFMGAVSRWHSF